MHADVVYFKILRLHGRLGSTRAILTESGALKVLRRKFKTAHCEEIELRPLSFTKKFRELQNTLKIIVELNFDFLVTFVWERSLPVPRDRHHTRPFIMATQCQEFVTE